MLVCLLLPALLGSATSLVAREPDDSRSFGCIPPYHGKPDPPTWLRGLSHALAVSRVPITRHYVYEAYGDGHGEWLVRYIHLPEGGEGQPQVQQAFLFHSDPLQQPGRIQCADIQFRAAEACWHGTRFTLVDRRDLKTR